MSNPNFEFQLSESGKSGLLTCRRELNVQYAAELKSTLVDALSQVEQLVLNLEQVTEIDLSGIQLLYSVFQTAQEENKQVKLTGNCPVGVKHAIEDSGYTNYSWLNFG